MKKRIFVLALCLCLLLTALPLTASAGSNLSFVAINDTLPPELINGFTYYGGAVYVPAWIFAAYGLGIYYSYTADNNTATLYSGGSKLVFDLANSVTFDGNGNHYSLCGIMWGGSVYVPLSYVVSYFGTFSYSTISTEYGSVLRLKNSGAVHSDGDFMKLALPILRQYDEQYNTDKGDEGDNNSGQNDGGYQHEGSDVLLAFYGLPSEESIVLLEQSGIRGCFFLSAEQVETDPGRVRELACRGHGLGVFWDGSEGGFEQTADLIFQASRTNTILVSSSEENEEGCAALAGELSLVHFAADIRALYGPEEGRSPYNITAAIEVSDPSADVAVLINCQEGMEETVRILINYLTANKFDIFTPSEILF